MFIAMNRFQVKLGNEAEFERIWRERDIYLTCCWLETLCTAEVRVLGWAYRELYGRPFHPNNF